MIVFVLYGCIQKVRKFILLEGSEGEPPPQQGPPSRWAWDHQEVDIFQQEIVILSYEKQRLNKNLQFTNFLLQKKSTFFWNLWFHEKKNTKIQIGKCVLLWKEGVTAIAIVWEKKSDSSMKAKHFTIKVLIIVKFEMLWQNFTFWKVDFFLLLLII